MAVLANSASAWQPSLSDDDGAPADKNSKKALHEELRKLRPTDADAFGSTICVEDTSLAFAATLSVCPLHQEDKSSYVEVPMRPLHTIPGVTDDDKPMQTKYFVAVPGERFIVKAKQMQYSLEANVDYGAFIYINKGKGPKAGEYDHAYSWGPPKDWPVRNAGFSDQPQKRAVLTFDGFMKGKKQAYEFRFGDGMLAPGGAGNSRTHATVDVDDVGWIVLRYRKVLRYESVVPRTGARPKRPKLSGSKPSTATVVLPGMAVEAFDEYDHTVQPVFDDAVLFESRIRFAPWGTLIFELAYVFRQSASWWKSYLALPLQAIHELRQMLHERVHNEVTKDLETEAVRLEDMVRANNIRFDARASLIMCNCIEVYGSSPEVFLQEKPVLIADGPKWDALIDEDPSFDRKLQGLFDYYTSHQERWELVKTDANVDGVGNVARRLSVKQRKIDIPSLDGGEASRFCIKFMSQDGSETPFTISPSTVMGDIIKAYCQRWSITNPASWRFAFDGDRVNPISTAADYELEEGESIDVSFERTGGVM